jgi:hypothetical protein
VLGEPSLADLTSSNRRTIWMEAYLVGGYLAAGGGAAVLGIAELLELTAFIGIGVREGDPRRQQWLLRRLLHMLRL